MGGVMGMGLKCSLVRMKEWIDYFILYKISSFVLYIPKS